jgi:hypothetical protein
MIATWWLMVVLATNEVTMTPVSEELCRRSAQLPMGTTITVTNANGERMVGSFWACLWQQDPRSGAFRYLEVPAS